MVVLTDVLTGRVPLRIPFAHLSGRQVSHPGLKEGENEQKYTMPLFFASEVKRRFLRFSLVIWSGVRRSPPIHEDAPLDGYRGTSLIRNSPPLEPYCRTMPRALWWS